MLALRCCTTVGRLRSRNRHALHTDTTVANYQEELKQAKLKATNQEDLSSYDEEMMNMIYAFASKDHDGKLTFEEALRAFLVLVILEEDGQPGSERFTDLATAKAAAVAKFDEADIDTKMKELSMVYIFMVFPLL